MLRYIPACLLASSALLTIGCTGNRTADGALIGAGAGAVAGEVLGGSPVTGAAIGAAGGAVAGAVTDDDEPDRR